MGVLTSSHFHGLCMDEKTSSIRIDVEKKQEKVNGNFLTLEKSIKAIHLIWVTLKGVFIKEQGLIGFRKP